MDETHAHEINGYEDLLNYPEMRIPDGRHQISAPCYDNYMIEMSLRYGQHCGAYTCDGIMRAYSKWSDYCL